MMKMMMVSGAGVCADSIDTVVLFGGGGMAVVVRFYYCSQLLVVICDRPTHRVKDRPTNGPYNAFLSFFCRRCQFCRCNFNINLLKLC